MTERQKTFLTNMEQALTEMIGDYLTANKLDLENAGFKDDENLHINMARSAMREMVGDESYNYTPHFLEWRERYWKREVKILEWKTQTKHFTTSELHGFYNQAFLTTPTKGGSNG